MTKIRSRDLSIELLKAMGCPLEQCQSVHIDMPRDHLVRVSLTYTLDPSWLEEACKAVIQGESDQPRERLEVKYVSVFPDEKADGMGPQD